MTGKEGDVSVLDLPDDDRRRRFSVRSVDLDLLGVVEERVEPRAAEDADLRAAQAVFSFFEGEVSGVFFSVVSFFFSVFTPVPDAPPSLEAREPAGRASVR